MKSQSGILYKYDVFFRLTVSVVKGMFFSASKHAKDMFAAQYEMTAQMYALSRSDR